MVTSTSFEKLKPALVRSWSLLGIPDKVTHDNGPPYNSRAWREYAQEKGFKLNPCTQEHPKSNSIVERFMGCWSRPCMRRWPWERTHRLRSRGDS